MANYQESYYTLEYQSLHEEINDSYNCVKTNPSLSLASEVTTIKDKIEGLNISSFWDDTVGDKFTSIKESFVQNLNAIISSIEGPFLTADNTYVDLKAVLDNLKANDETYKQLKTKEPQKANYMETVNYTDNLGEQKSYTRINESAYNKDLGLWQDKMDSFVSNFESLYQNITDDKASLTNINGSPFSLGALNLPSLPTINEISDAFKMLASLPLFTQKDYFLNELGWTEKNPFETRYSQGDSSISFAGGPLNSTGCGGAAFAYAVACALTREYGTNVNIPPKRFLSYLYKTAGSKSTTYGSNGYSWTSKLPEDITKCFQDVSIIEFSENRDGVFDKDSMKEVTDAGIAIVDSLKDQGHIVCATAVDSSGNVTTMDPGFRGNETVSFGEKLHRKGNNYGGYIDSKKSWGTVPNSSISISGDKLLIKGLDANKVPSMDAIYINGERYGDVKVNNDGSISATNLNATTVAKSVSI